MKIYTKTGDTGETSLVGGTRVLKSHFRIETYGTIDELNAWVGLLAEYSINETRKPLLREIQDRLFSIGSLLASEAENKFKLPSLEEEDILRIEREIDSINENLSPLKHFILPGGHKEVAFCHVARTVCRRAERLAVALHEKEPIDILIIKYLNRLSDYLFILGRIMAKDMNVVEVIWKPRIKQD